MSYQYYTDMGYTNLTEINGMLCGIYRFMFTHGVCTDMNELGYGKRFCFDSLCEAEGFLRDWDGITEPVVGENGCTAIKGY